MERKASPALDGKASKMFGRISSFMESARGSVEDLLQTIVDDTNNFGNQPANCSSRTNHGARTNNNVGATRVNASAARVNVKKDVNGSQDALDFVQGLMQDASAAKKLFISYDKLLTRKSKEDTSQSTRFSMTSEQNLHARTVIEAIPAFDRLRFTLCPSYMPDSRFWEVYFTLIWERCSLSASKDDENTLDAIYDSPAVKNLAKVASPKHQATNAQTTTSLAEAKEEVVSPEDLNKGMKRERENSEEGSNIAGDIAIVSRLLFDGARRTFQFAEQLMEAMDERASDAAARSSTCAVDATVAIADPGAKSSSSLSSNAMTSPSVAPPLPSQNTATTTVGTEKSDTKRGRFEESSEPLAEPVEKTLTTSRSLVSYPSQGSLASSSSDGAETDGLSVASIDDADLGEWAKVSARTHGKTARKTRSSVVEEHVEDFEWI